MQLADDAFSSSQIESKIWLAENLERAIEHYHLANPLRILLIGGWYGLANLILRTRNKIPVLHVRSIDIDQESCNNADIINECWVSKNWQFKSIVADANKFDCSNFDCIINTVVEHIECDDWFENIPAGSLVALQSNNMTHKDHVNIHSSLSNFDKAYPLKDTFFLKSKDIRYPTWSFKRFMKIGLK
jgi:hypothetical protein